MKLTEDRFESSRPEQILHNRLIPLAIAIGELSRFHFQSSPFSVRNAALRR